MCTVCHTGHWQVGSAAPPLLAVIINALDNGQALRWVMLGGVAFSYSTAALCFVMSARCVAQRERRQGGARPVGIAAVEGAVAGTANAAVAGDGDHANEGDRLHATSDVAGAASA